VESTFAGSTLVFPGRRGAPFSNKAIQGRIKLACQRNERRANLRDLEALLAHKNIATTALHADRF
jgi:hypothetical protein